MQVARELPKLCVEFHEDVQRLSADFLSQQRRHYYVTPTSYLELLTSYKKLLAKKQDEVWLWHWTTFCACALVQYCVGFVPAAKPQAAALTGVFDLSRAPQIGTAKKRYEIGLDKLATTETSVAGMQVHGQLCTRVHQLRLPAQHEEDTHTSAGEHVHAVCAGAQCECLCVCVCMQEELIALQPQLEESTRQTEAAMDVIAKETVEADKVKKVRRLSRAQPSQCLHAHFLSELCLLWFRPQGGFAAGVGVGRESRASVDCSLCHPCFALPLARAAADAD